MVVLLATDESGQVLRRAPLPHGADPAAVLRALGLHPTWEGADRGPDGEVVLRYRVRPGEPVPHPHQRVAAYAVVTASWQGRECVLLTTLSGTGRHGWWGLPGGGVDPGEEPEVAVVREVMEETGQHARVDGPLELVSGHWTGRAPGGRWEDFHALRLVYRAEVTTPVQPVVHDVGGTTGEAAWVPRDAVRDLLLLEWTRVLLAAALPQEGTG